MAHVAATYDFVVIGAGSAGCAVAAALAERQAGSVLVVEAGPSDRWPLVRMPFGLVWTMGSKTRDWRYRSAPQPGADGRRIGIPRGRMLGGSGSINSMLWFRGCASDFDVWNVEGWAWSDVAPAFEAVEAALRPGRLATPHPLTEALGGLFGANDPTAPPTPEHQSAGVGYFNLHNGRRWSAADAFLRPALAGRVSVLQNHQVSDIAIDGDRARQVRFTDGTAVAARKGVVLSAGAIGSPEILLNSGIGPAEDLRAAGRDTRIDLPGIGANLHDHPGAGLHFMGDGSGYGLHPSLTARWLAAPLQWLLSGRGILASPTVEGAAFFNAAGVDATAPDIQSHFIPFLLGWDGRKYLRGQGYFADAVVCRPVSRGRIALGKAGLEIDLGLFADEADLDLLTRGWMRLRALLADAPFGARKAVEMFPGEAVRSEEAARAHIRATCGTAYHPVGTCALGGPLTPRCAVRGVDGLWVADASVMPRITSANTNAPAMMIGHRAGQMIAEDAA